MRNQQGQSLTEFLIFIPLFFILLSGINFYLNQEMRVLTEESALDALLVSDALFDDLERLEAQWEHSSKTTSQISNSILYNSLNSSQYFSKSVDLQNDVFLDKTKVIKNSTEMCANETGYLLRAVQSGQFEFSTCGQSKGFEASEYSYQDFRSKNRSAKHMQSQHFFSAKSLYYPSVEFEWHQREKLAESALKKLPLSVEGPMFFALYASPIPLEKNFNSQCFMNPYQPGCSRPSLSGKWRRAAYDGANAQVLGCFTEMSGKCLKYAAPQAIAACMVEGTGEISFALANGEKAPVCPLFNTLAEVMYKAAQANYF